MNSLRSRVRPGGHAPALGLLAAWATLHLVTQSLVWADSPQLSVQTDFPGGSGQVVDIDQSQRRIRITPTEYPDRGWVCWWYIHVTGLVPGESLTLEVGDAPWATPHQAAVSEDGRSWKQTLPGQALGKQMRYRHQVRAKEAWFAWGPPFTPDDAEQLVHDAAKRCAEAKAFQLCHTREGRAVPALQVASPVAEAQAVPYGIWIQARQHAWESGSSWVCAGLVDWLVSDEPQARQLRELAHVTVVPVMDVDSVAVGAGGKEQHPHDHNRDWSDSPHWPAVRAAMQRITAHNEAGRMDIFVDLHNPGASARHPFYYVTPRSLLTDQGRRNLDRFLAASQLDMTGPLSYRGETQQSGPDYDPRWKHIGKNWVSFHCASHVVSVTLETPWNTPHSDTEGYRAVGRQLGLAITRYLRTSPRAGND